MSRAPPRSAPREYDERPTPTEHAPGAVLWGVLAQLRHPRILATFLVSGLGAAAATFALIGAGGVPARARPLAVPGALVVLTAWLVAYRQAGPIVGKTRPLGPGRVWVALRRLPDLLVLYGAVALSVYAVARLSLLLLSGHYTPRLAFLLASTAILVHVLPAAPVLVLEDVSIPSAIARSWRLARGRRLTILGLLLFALLASVSLWLLLHALLATYRPLGVLAVLGAITGIAVGGFHLAVVRISA